MRGTLKENNQGNKSLGIIPVMRGTFTDALSGRIHNEDHPRHAGNI